MGKILFLMPALLILVLVAMEVYFMAAKGRKQKAYKEEDKDATSHQRQLCPRCRIGKESYERDRQSTTCPHIFCLKDGKCQYYVPLAREEKR